MKLLLKQTIHLLTFILLLTTTAFLNKAHSQTKYEAESAALTGVSVATSHTGYSGTGYVDGFDNNADKITFTVNVSAAGDYPLVIHYSGPYGEKYQTLQVNGTTVSACAVQFPANNGWVDKAYGNVTLNAGNNTIAILHCYGWFQLDYITVDSGGGTTPPPPSPSGSMTPGTNFWNIEWDGWQNYFAQGINWATTTNPWNPTFISELQDAKIKCLRFMDWNVTNNSCVTSWSQRIPKTANHYNSGNTIPCFRDNWDANTNTHTLTWNAYNAYGVAFEWQIDLCNRIGADMWVNIPVAADNNFIDQLADLIKNQLNAGLKVYVEYGNEDWNTGFCTWVWCYQKALELGLQNVDVGFYCEPWRKYTVYASVRAFQRFETKFGANSSRLVKVIGGQLGYHWGGYDYNHMALGDFAALNNTTINSANTTINAWAIAPYMGGQSVTEMRNELAETFQSVQWAKNSLNNTPYSLLCYEGGSDNYPDNSLTITRNAEQQQLYVDFLTGLAPHVNGVFNQYCFYGGCWGLKVDAGESPSINPKWRGWLDYWNAQPPLVTALNDVSDSISTGKNTKSLQIYPNPVKGGSFSFNLWADKASDAKMMIYSSNMAKVLETQRSLAAGSTTITLPVAHLQNGIYFLVIKKGNERMMQKVVISK